MRIRAYLDAGLEAVVAGLMATMCITVFLGVVFRYVLGDPLTWAEEVGRLSLVWVTFLGAYLAYRRNVHISIDLIRTRTSRGTQRIIHLVSMILIGLFMAMLLVQGGNYSRAVLGSATPLLGIPLGVVYAALPVCAALLLVTILLDLVDFLRGRSPEDEAPKGDAI